MWQLPNMESWRRSISATSGKPLLPSFPPYRLTETSIAICCRRITSVPDLSGLTKLRELDLICCEQLVSLPDLSNLKQLKMIRLNGCERRPSLLTYLLALSQITLLRLSLLSVAIG